MKFVIRVDRAGTIYETNTMSIASACGGRRPSVVSCCVVGVRSKQKGDLLVGFFLAGHHTHLIKNIFGLLIELL